VLDHRWILKHGIHFSDVDNETVRQRGAHVIYTPTSEAIRGGGFGPITKLHRAGVNCALGSDGPMVDYSVDMVEQMKATIFLQSLKHREALALSASTVLEMATINAAMALGLEQDIGSLEPGKKADIAVFDVSRQAATTADLLVALVCGGRGADADTVFVNGRAVLRAGCFTRFKDTDRVVREANERGRRIARDAKLDQRATPHWPSLERLAAE
jgi:5-methylthioadenosine/S-adenosylhomocysteine deaminase